MKDLRGKVAVVTGAGSGIGRAIAHALAESQVKIVVSDINPESAGVVVREILAAGGDAIAVQTDVSDHGSVIALAERAYARYAAVHILCNNAGVSWRPFRTIFDATISDWNLMIGVNLWGVIHGLDVFLPRMQSQVGDKHIVNTSSLAGILPLAGLAPYSATKAAVTSLSETMAEELAPFGFGVTILTPGVVKTNVVVNSDALRSEHQRAAAARITPYVNPLLVHLGLQAIEAGDVGRMVKNAIVHNQLYLHTQAVPSNIVQARMSTMFGPHTLGTK